MPTLELDHLLEACGAGGATCLTSRTELEPAAGPHAAVAPAKFAQRGRDAGVYAYEKRYIDGQPSQGVLIDSKQSQNNRCEDGLRMAIEDGHPLLSRLPRIEVTYDQGGTSEVYSDLSLPHRAFDGHIRAGSVGGVPVTQFEAYRAIRDATPANARALLDASPVSLIFGSWDSSRARRQGRWRSALVGEVIGFCADDETALKGGARTDPVGMKVELTEKAMKELATQQCAELSGALYSKAIKEAEQA